MCQLHLTCSTELEAGSGLLSVGASRVLSRNLRVLPGVIRPTRSEGLSSWETLGCQSVSVKTGHGLSLEVTDTQLQRNSACCMGPMHAKP